MPVMREHNLLFLHIPKNAGKAIEDVFLGHGGSSAVGRRNLINLIAKGVLRITSSKTAQEKLLGSYDYTFAAQHLTYAEICKLGLIDAAVLDKLTTFAVIRDPYDRAASSVFHFFGNRIKADQIRIDTPAKFYRALEEWLEHRPTDHNQHAHRRLQFDYLTLDGRQIDVSHVLRYERLTKDFNAFANKMGVAATQLPWVGRKREVRDVEALYNDAARALVRHHFGRDFAELGYDAV